MSGIEYRRFMRTLIVNGRQNYILPNYRFWAEHEEEFREWLDNKTEVGRDAMEGMTVSFANEKEELMFRLKWGGQAQKNQSYGVTQLNNSVTC